MSAGPSAVVEETLLVEYFHFALQCFPSGTIALGLGIPPGRLLGGIGGATFRSEATDHYTPIRLELWPADPPADRTTTWDAVESAQFWTDAPQLRLTAVTAEVSDQALIVAYPGRYGIRAHVVQTAPLPTGLGPDFAEGLERWLIQVWPLAPDTA
jgi:hypothetical protein